MQQHLAGIVFGATCPTCLLVLAFVSGHLVCVYYQPGVYRVCMPVQVMDGGCSVGYQFAVLTTAHSPHISCQDRFKSPNGVTVCCVC